MNLEQRLRQLNQHREGPALTKEEIVAEYDRLYKQPKRVTPATHPELFDPLNPPEGWEYDAWHAIWWQPTQTSYEFNLFIVRAAAVFLVCCVLWAATSAYYK